MSNSPKVTTLPPAPESENLRFQQYQADRILGTGAGKRTLTQGEYRGLYASDNTLGTLIHEAILRALKNFLTLTNLPQGKNLPLNP
jgi:hypothetical protein